MNQTDLLQNLAGVAAVLTAIGLFYRLWRIDRRTAGVGELVAERAENRALRSEVNELEKRANEAERRANASEARELRLEQLVEQLRTDVERLRADVDYWKRRVTELTAGGG